MSGQLIDGRLHVYIARDQPATRYVVDVSLKAHPFWIRHRRRSRLPAHCCGKQRWAAYLIAHVYYDGIYYFCRKGKGCKA